MKGAYHQSKQHPSDEDWLAAQNASEREKLRETTKEFLYLLRQELLAQYMRRRYQISDDHD